MERGVDVFADADERRREWESGGWRCRRESDARRHSTLKDILGRASDLSDATCRIGRAVTQSQSIPSILDFISPRREKTLTRPNRHPPRLLTAQQCPSITLSRTPASLPPRSRAPLARSSALYVLAAPECDVRDRCVLALEEAKVGFTRRGDEARGRGERVEQAHIVWPYVRVHVGICRVRYRVKGSRCGMCVCGHCDVMGWS